MSLVCAARFANQWGRLLQLSQEAPSSNPDQEAAQICIRADLALFRQNDPGLARTLFKQAIELSTSIPDARLRLACMALFEDGKFVLDGCGYINCGLTNLPPSVVSEAYDWLMPIESSDDSRIATELSQTPYRWLLMAQSIYLRGFIEEQRGNFSAASQVYSDLWGLLVSPVLTTLTKPSAASALPELSVADPHRINQVSNLSIAVLAGKCRVLLRLGQFNPFLEIARQWCHFDGQLALVPHVQLGLCQRFAEMLVFYNLSLYHLYFDDHNRKTKCDFRSPLEEAALLLWVIMERIHSEFPDLEAEVGRTTRRTAQLLLSLCDQFTMISDIYRDDIALDLSDSELWFIRSLALFCSENYVESYQAAKQAIKLYPKGIDRLLFASKLLLNHLSNAKQSLKLAENALSLCRRVHPQWVACHFISGAASSRLAYEVWTFSRRKKLQQEALKLAIEAGNYQPKNQKIIFGIAAIQADIREINLAIRLTKHSLSLNSSHFESWNLMALLLTSQKLYDEAFQVCNAGSLECHHSYNLHFIFTQCKVLVGQLLSEDLLPSEQSLLVNRAFESFQTFFSKAFLNCVQLKLVGIGPFHSCPVLFRGSELDAPVSLIQQTYAVKSQTLQNYCSPAFKYEDPDSLQYRAILALVDLYAFIARASTFKLSNALPFAYSCLDYLIGLGSASWLPDVYVKLGQLSEQTQDDATALSHYELALSFDDQHTETLVRIGALHKKLQKIVIAHEYLLNALRIDSTLHDAWLEIGDILHAQGKYDAASDAITTALELERTAPVETFYTVMRRV